MMQRSIWVLLLIAWGIVASAMQGEELVPPVTLKPSHPNYWYGHKIWPIYRQFKETKSLALCNRLIDALETLLANFPDARFVPPPYLVRAKSFYMLDDAGGPLGMLAELYHFQGRYEEALIFQLRKSLVMMEDIAMMIASGLGIFPNSLKSDPPFIFELKPSIEYAQQLLSQKVKVHPVLFACGWPLRVKWKGNNPNDALVSLNDIAYALGKGNWQDILQRDYKSWRFTLSVKGKTITFTDKSQKAVIEGKEATLRYPVERSYYDLYVPLIDLVKLIGGNLRPPKPDELQPLRRYLPVQIWVVDLN